MEIYTIIIVNITFPIRAAAAVAVAVAVADVLKKTMGNTNLFRLFVTGFLSLYYVVKEMDSRSYHRTKADDKIRIIRKMSLEDDRKNKLNHKLVNSFTVIYINLEKYRSI